MNILRIRDMALGFVLCLACLAIMKCSGSSSPTAAHADPLASNLQAVAAGTGTNDDIHFAVIDVNTGEVKHLFRIDNNNFPMRQ